MTITINQAIEALNRYFDSEIGQKATGAKKFMAYFVWGTYSNKLPTLLAPFTAEDNTINVDVVYAAAKEAYTKSGPITIAGITFNDRDIETLYSYMKEAGYNVQN